MSVHSFCPEVGAPAGATAAPAAGVPAGGAADDATGACTGLALKVLGVGPVAGAIVVGAA